MRVSTGNYVSQIFPSFVRKQARRVWGISLIFVAFWVFLILFAPVAENAGWHPISSNIYNFFGYICHQMPERSFHIAAHPFAVCSRCFGVYSGLFGGILIYPFFKQIEDIEPPSRIWLFLALIPMGIDWSLGVFGVWENTHFSRFVSGVVLGVACAVFIVPALIELFRLLLVKK